ncbi:hypothetical protein J3459_017809 [Metarhizium acridum]|nr:hypothetical protein J3459_017809 [Metarhizium acridum]
MKADGNITVGKPKAFIEAPMTNITILQNSLLATYASMGSQVYGKGNANVSEMDLLHEAISSIQYIKYIDAKVKKEKMRALILGILTIDFMVIPFVGEAPDL